MRVSIIIPIYNVEPYVERCLRSVMAQTYKGSLECILVDDCGMDRSMEVVEQLVANYHGPICFRIIRHDYNRGVSAARNTGMEAATGQYLFYMDSDDEIIPECIEKMVDITKKYPNVEMVEGHRRVFSQITQKVIDEWANIKDIDYINDNNWIREHFFCCGERILVTPWNKLIKKSFIINNSLYFKEGIIHEDVLWMFYVAKKLKKYSVVKEPTYIYYNVPNSISTSTPNNLKASNWRIILEEITNNFDEPSFDRQVAFAMLYMIDYFDGIEKEWHTYRRLAKKFGIILFKRKHFFLSLLFFSYVYSLPLNKWRKGKRRLLGTLRKMCC